MQNAYHIDPRVIACYLALRKTKRHTPGYAWFLACVHAARVAS